MTQDAGRAYALLADGGTVEIRRAGRADFGAVRAMHQAMSADNTYLRFFSLSKLSAENEARRICRDPRPGHAALLALAAGQVVGCASYDTAGGAEDQQSVAEIAFAVADHMHHRGIATLLLEHLVAFARRRQITVFTAQTLAENASMLKVFAAAGLPVQRHYGGGVMDLTIPLPREGGGTALDSYLDAVAERESRADTASLRHVLAPESVVVIGASRRRGTVGREIFDNIRSGGYAGRLYVVNPRARQISGVHCLSSVLDLPEPADLAVIAVPAAEVLGVAEQCGRRGVRSVVVITAGLDAAACADLLAVCRRHGMRLVGPDCFGVAVPGIGLDATFGARHARPGAAGLVMQSGGLGFALVDQLSRLGIGVSSFASVGRKLDVSSNDMLMWWEHDGITRLAVLYIESFGNPRKFARTARRVSSRMPVLTVEPPAPAEPVASREALFEQAGVITTSSFGGLVEATALLASQPVPAGRTVAIVTNVGSAGMLAADVCARRGLAVYRPHGLTRRRLRALVPDGGTITGPVDATEAVSAQDFQRCLELLAADDEVDALLALVLPTAAGDLVAALQHAAVAVPLAAAVLDQPEAVRLIPRADGEGPIPAYGYPEAAAAALAGAARYGAWRAEPRGQVPRFADIRAEDARTLVQDFLRVTRRGGWLPPGPAAELLGCYGLPLAGRGPVSIEDEAAAAPMMAGGTELAAGVSDDRMFGPVVVLGLGGAAAAVLGDRAARLTPLTDLDADRLIGSLRAAPLLRGLRGGPPADLDALRGMLLRLSCLAEDLPEIAQLDLNPVMARPDGVFVLGTRVRVMPYRPHDPFLRKLS